MDEQATEYSLLAEDRGMLVSGIGLLSVGSVVMLIGGLITSAVAVRATRRWVEHLDEPPTAVARRTWGQARSAVAAGARGWQDNSGTTSGTVATRFSPGKTSLGTPITCAMNPPWFRPILLARDCEVFLAAATGLP